MPHIFDNINLHLLPDLKQTLSEAYRADFCVGYFNLRGWKLINQQIENWFGGDGNHVRLLVGMQRMPQDELKSIYRFSHSEDEIDNQTAIRIKRKLAEEFRMQLATGAPSNEDEIALHRITAHPYAGKVIFRIEVKPAPEPVFVGGVIYIRANSRHLPILASQNYKYIKEHWG